MTDPALLNRSPVPDQDHWPTSDGSSVDCREKLHVLRENQAELSQSLRDCFDDAVLMGVDPEAMRGILRSMVDALRDPRHGGAKSG